MTYQPEAREHPTTSDSGSHSFAAVSVRLSSRRTMRGSLPRIANQETENPILISEFLKIRLESCCCTRGDYIHLVEGGNTRERLQQSGPRVPKSSRRQLMARGCRVGRVQQVGRYPGYTGRP